jgi:hypothetical protein
MNTLPDAQAAGDLASETPFEAWLDMQIRVRAAMRLVIDAVLLAIRSGDCCDRSRFRETRTNRVIA